MVHFTAQQIEGAVSLIRDGLRLTNHHSLLLLTQRDLADAAACIREAASQLGVQVDERVFRSDEFADRYPESFSPETLKRNEVRPSGIVLLIEWSEETTRSRLALLTDLMSEAQTAWRIASMPGVDLEGLAYSVSDFPAINRYSLSSFAVLARTNAAIVKTTNPEGNIDSLVIPIGDYPPIVSTGEIDLNKWGNFPSGETFIVPDPYQAKGWVTIRGSIPRHPLKAGEWVRFQVARGRIVHSSLQASSAPLTELFERLCFHPSGRPKCKNSNALAELGIGTNPNIRKLTGKPIFDEKMLGTIHIAFGGNTQFHGPLESCVHHDLICTDVSLSVKNRFRAYEVVGENAFLLTPSQATPGLKEFDNIHDPDVSLRLGGFKYIFKPSSNNVPASLDIEYPSTRRHLTFRIAEGAEAEMAQAILKAVESTDQITVGQLIGNSDDTVRLSLSSIVSGLIEYGLLKET